MPHIHTLPNQVDYTVEVFIVHNSKVLLRKHDKYKIWLSVGGHIELNEDPNQAAIREVKEEVGLDVALYSPQPVPEYAEVGYTELIPPAFLNRHRINDSHEHVTSTYFGTVDSDQVAPENKSDIWHWFTRDEIISSKEIKESIKNYALRALSTLA